MARVLYPAFLDFVGRRVLVVGAGAVATGKIPRLVEVGAQVVVVAPEIAPAIEHLPIEIARRPFQPSDATRLDSREIFREAVFLWITPRATPRAISGWTFFSASAASAFLPSAIADSTALMKVRMRPIRE